MLSPSPGRAPKAVPGIYCRLVFCQPLPYISELLPLAALRRRSLCVGLGYVLAMRFSQLPPCQMRYRLPSYVCSLVHLEHDASHGPPSPAGVRAFSAGRNVIQSTIALITGAASITVALISNRKKTDRPPNVDKAIPEAAPINAARAKAIRVRLISVMTLAMSQRGPQPEIAT